MFTGLVQCLGKVTQVTPHPQGRQLEIDSDLSLRDRSLGASIAVQGVCLTVTAAAGRRFCAFAGFETLRASTLGSLQAGQTVNLEPALRVGDPLGGHLVGGHVDGVGTLSSARMRGPTRELGFKAPVELMKYLAVKGSVAIDGVSLTINQLGPQELYVGIIPHTQGATTLQDLRVHARVNLEVDVLARYTERLLAAGHAQGAASSEQTGYPPDHQTPGHSGLSVTDLVAQGFAR